MNKRILSLSFLCILVLYVFYLLSFSDSELIVVSVDKRNAFGASESYPVVYPEVGISVIKLKAGGGVDVNGISRFQYVLNAYHVAEHDSDKNRVKRIEGLLDYYLEKGDNINQENDVGCTPLQAAVLSGSYGAVNYLLRKGASHDSVGVSENLNNNICDHEAYVLANLLAKQEGTTTRKRIMQLLRKKQ